MSPEQGRGVGLTERGQAGSVQARGRTAGRVPTERLTIYIQPRPQNTQDKVVYDLRAQTGPGPAGVRPASQAPPFGTHGVRFNHREWSWIGPAFTFSHPVVITFFSTYSNLPSHWKMAG